MSRIPKLDSRGQTQIKVGRETREAVIALRQILQEEIPDFDVSFSQTVRIAVERELKRQWAKKKDAS